MPSRRQHRITSTTKLTLTSNLTATAHRGALPRHLPREEIVIEPDDQACPCCGGAMHRIGEDVAERLDMIPAQFRVIVTRRPKYGCRACESAVVQAPAPAWLIEGGMPTARLAPRADLGGRPGAARLVAHVLVGKYADHLPLYRQSQIYARQGIELDRSTLADWVGRAAAELRPLHERLFEHLKRSPKLFMDETRAPVLDPGRKRTKTGYLWAVARDDRPWAGPDPPAQSPCQPSQITRPAISCSTVEFSRRNPPHSLADCRG